MKDYPLDRDSLHRLSALISQHFVNVFDSIVTSLSHLNLRELRNGTSTAE